MRRVIQNLLRLYGWASVPLVYMVAVSAVIADDQETYRLGRIEIHNQPIFTTTQRDTRPLFELMDRLHVTTTETTIRRTLVKREGDRVTLLDVAEMERRLRALGVFNTVDVQIVKQAQDDSADIVIKVSTRDRLSFFPLLLPFSIGGISGFSAQIVENNLFGTADQLSLRTERNSEQERETRFSYTNRHIGNSPFSVTINAATTEEGGSLGINLEKPFLHEQDTWNWTLSLEQKKDGIDYFESGKSVAEVPLFSSAADFSIAHAYGKTGRRNFLGLSIAYENNDYDNAEGSLGETIDVPGDSSNTTVGVFHQLRRNTRFVREKI